MPHGLKIRILPSEICGPKRGLSESLDLITDHDEKYVFPRQDTELKQA
jgi:hypothetical protein